MPSRVSARLPHLSKHDVAEIDAEIRAAQSELGHSKVGAPIVGEPVIKSDATKL